MDSEDNKQIKTEDSSINDMIEGVNVTDSQSGDMNTTIEQPINTPKKPCKIWKLFLIILIPLLIAGAVMAVFWVLNDELPGFSKKINLDTTKATKEGQEYLIEANNKFAFDLYPELSKEDNTFYSPYSISSAIAIVHEGAKGETANEIESTLHFPELAVLRNNFGAIYENINKKNDNYELATGNALWIDESLPIKQDYLDIVTNSYDGKASNVDFVNAKQKAIKIINDYISKQTKEKIPNLLSEAVVSDLTKLIITNAIYFKGDWQKSFNPDDTREDGLFFKTDDQVIETDMMYMYETEDFKYVEDHSLQILELPYKGHDLSMLVILPKKDLSSISKLLKADKLEKYRQSMTEQDIKTIALPRFKLDTEYKLVHNLSNLGMKKAFEPTADFSNIAVNESGRSSLYISEVIHKAYVDVNEEGTEAAAATAIIMKDEAAPTEASKEIKFIANRPFVFIIQENKSGNILFMGKISDPSKK